MAINMLILALAPVGILLAYTFFRDKYEKEPWDMLLVALAMGIFSSIPIVWVERGFSLLGSSLYGWTSIFYDSFIVASFTEELFKFIFLYILIWKSPEFNEKFDGIVYAVFISLGFAAVENVMYVFDYGIQAGFTRAITAVPAHFLFGVNMGFFVGLARFYPERRRKLLWLAVFYPILLHGIYNFILMSNHSWALLIFIPYIIFMWRTGMREMKQLSDSSIFRNDFNGDHDLFKDE